MILVNEFSKVKGFYRLYGAEENQCWAELREILQGCFGGKLEE